MADNSETLTNIITIIKNNGYFPTNNDVKTLQALIQMPLL